MSAAVKDAKRTGTKKSVHQIDSSSPVEVKPVEMAKPLYAEHPKAQGNKIVAPWCGLMVLVRLFGGDQRKFHRTHRRVLRWRVAKPPVERGGPHNPNKTEHKKHAPRQETMEDHNQGRARLRRRSAHWPP